MEGSDELMVRSRARDQDDLDQLYREYRPRLVRRLSLVVRDMDEAEDLAQLAFLRATERNDRPEGTGLEAWLAVVGIRLAIDEQRRRRRWGLFQISEGSSSSTMQSDPDLWRALGSLDRRTRAVLVLTVLDGYTQAEVANLLKVPRGTVSSWLSRARDKLRPMLEDSENG